MNYYSGTWQHKLFCWFWKNRLTITLFGCTFERRVIAVKNWRTALVVDMDNYGKEYQRSTITFMIKLWNWYL